MSEVAIRVNCGARSRRGGGRRRSSNRRSGVLEWADMRRYLAGEEKIYIADSLKRQKWEPSVDDPKTPESNSGFDLTRGAFRKVLTLLLNVSLCALIASAPSNHIARCNAFTSLRANSTAYPDL